MTVLSNFKGYKVEFKKNAKKDFEKLPTKIATEIEKKLSHMVAGAENLNIKKLVGYTPPTHRLRVGDYRIIFEIHNKEIIILVINIAHRKDAY